MRSACRSRNFLVRKHPAPLGRIVRQVSCLHFPFLRGPFYDIENAACVFSSSSPWRGSADRRGTGAAAGAGAAATAPINQSDDPLLKTFVWRSIGPANMGGPHRRHRRARQSNPSVFYLGFATGGVWKTVNNGTTFHTDLRHLPDLFHRRHRGRAGQPGHRLGGDRRAEQPPELVVRRRDLQVDRRREDVHEHGPQGHAEHRAGRDRPEGPGTSCTSRP